MYANPHTGTRVHSHVVHEYVCTSLAHTSSHANVHQGTHARALAFTHAWCMHTRAYKPTNIYVQAAVLNVGTEELKVQKIEAKSSEVSVACTTCAHV